MIRVQFPFEYNEAGKILPRVSAHVREGRGVDLGCGWSGGGSGGVMDAPYYNAPPGERATDPEWQPRYITERSRCRDCGATQTENWFYLPAGDYCESCWAIRDARGELDDPRTRSEIHAAMQRRTA